MIIQPIIKAMLEKNMNNRTAKRRRLRRLLVGLTIKIWASGRFGIADFFHAIHPKIVIGLVTHISAMSQYQKHSSPRTRQNLACKIFADQAFTFAYRPRSV